MKNVLPNAYLTITKGRQYLNSSWLAAYEWSHSGTSPACYFRNSTRIYTNCTGG